MASTCPRVDTVPAAPPHFCRITLPRQLEARRWQEGPESSGMPAASGAAAKRARGTVAAANEAAGGSWFAFLTGIDRFSVRMEHFQLFLTGFESKAVRNQIRAVDIGGTPAAAVATADYYPPAPPGDGGRTPRHPLPLLI